jgi:hypothetical protein
LPQNHQRKASIKSQGCPLWVKSGSKNLHFDVRFTRKRTCAVERDVSAARLEDLFLLFALQLCIIGSNEGTNLAGHVEQP